MIKYVKGFKIHTGKWISLIVNYDSINRGNIGDFIMLLKRANVPD